MAHPGSGSEPVSLVVLTRDEAHHVAECLDAALAQLREGDEIVVVDAASRDGTLPIVERYAQAHPGRVRAHAFPVAVSVSEARSMGIEMSRHDVIVFLGADVVPESGWLDALRRKAADADIVYGRQRHQPARMSVAAVARGLRDRRFESTSEALPETFASSVNAAYRRFAFQTLPLDDELPGAQDVAFARMARLAGLRIAYAPDAVVHRREVASLQGEWRTQLSQGAAWAQLRSLLGTPKLHLLWATSVGVLGVAAIVLASVWLLALCLLAFFAPTIRRLVSPVARRYRAPHLVAGAAVSPVFDLAFVGSYLLGRMRTRG